MKGIWQFEMGAQIGRVRLMSAGQLKGWEEGMVRQQRRLVSRTRIRWSVQTAKETESQVEGETVRPTRNRKNDVPTPCSKFASSLSD